MEREGGKVLERERGVNSLCFVPVSVHYILSLSKINKAVHAKSYDDANRYLLCFQQNESSKDLGLYG